MSLLVWAVLGVIAGFVASRVVNVKGRDAVVNFGLGMVGAVIGGWLFNIFGVTGVTGFSPISLVAAVVGATVLLGAHHIVTIESIEANASVR